MARISCAIGLSKVGWPEARYKLVSSAHPPYSSDVSAWRVLHLCYCPLLFLADDVGVPFFWAILCRWREINVFDELSLLGFLNNAELPHQSPRPSNFVAAEFL